MTAFQVKICGITRPKDASLAASLGADMIGMIFDPGSPRYINLDVAREIVRALPAIVDRVAVFVNESPDRMLRTCDKLGCQYAQLHGNEAPSTVRQLQKSGLKVIKAFAISDRNDWSELTRYGADLLLVDSAKTNRAGHKGMPFDWTWKPIRRIPNLMLAGGISTANIEEGVRLFRPSVVDVSSSVESRPGAKSPRKLKQFFAVCNELRNGN